MNFFCKYGLTEFLWEEGNVSEELPPLKSLDFFKVHKNRCIIFASAGSDTFLSKLNKLQSVQTFVLLQTNAWKSKAKQRKAEFKVLFPKLWAVVQSEAKNCVSMRTHVQYVYVYMSTDVKLFWCSCVSVSWKRKQTVVVQHSYVLVVLAYNIQ